MKATLLNIRNFYSSKKDRDYTVIQYLRQLTPSEQNERGYIGFSICEETFVPDNLVNTFKDSDVDKEIDLQYSIIGGKAVLDNIVVK